MAYRTAPINVLIIMDAMICVVGKWAVVCDAWSMYVCICY